MILDTNALSAFADGDLDLSVVESGAQTHHLPVPVLGEYRFGLEFSRERDARLTWLDRREREFVVLSCTGQTARVYAIIRAELRRNGRPIPESDIWIAALAREHRLAILSKDRHFDLIPGIKRMDW